TVIPPRPTFLGVRTFDDYPLAELVERIDWTPFFATWELRGAYPAILDDATVGAAARDLYHDARALLDRIVADQRLRAAGVVGFWPANADDDDIVVWRDDDRRDPLAMFRTLRQQMAKQDGRPNVALADFVAPVSSSLADHIGAFAVTAGHGLDGEDGMVAEFAAAHDDYSAIMAKALADRLAEAFAERLHERVRRELWGYAPAEELTNADLIAERYQGIRPAPGYPACPDHTEKGPLFEMLQCERVGIRMTESYAMHPASSVSGFYFSHPESRYFAVGKIARDQVEDYARRKSMAVTEVERWLTSNLAYEPR
ncbi:MAG: vitamin B12 dependent-methionine synthase activation domain-containing protein, partial [Betaproteobacteria bacterium]